MKPKETNSLYEPGYRFYRKSYKKKTHTSSNKDEMWMNVNAAWILGLWFT